MTKRWDQVRPEVAQRLMAALDEYEKTGRIDPHYSAGIELNSCLQMARAEAAPPLRTKAEVDAAIVELVRAYSPEMLRRGGYSDLANLCAEPIAPEAEPKCGECGGIHGPGNTNTLCSRSSNYDKTLEERLKKQWTEPDPCSCEEALALRKKLEAVDALLLSLRQRSHAFSRGTVTRDVLERLFMELSECLK